MCQALVVMASLLLHGGPSDQIVFSVRTWQGEYFSRDIAGGVETSPAGSTIHVVNADGTGLKEIVRSNNYADAAQFSPDGQWLYFQSRLANAQNHLFRCKPDGTGVQQLTSPETLGKPWISAYGACLSADGKHMAFTVHDGGKGIVMVGDAEAKSFREAAPKLGYVYMAALSPDGASVVCTGPGTDYRLHLVKRADGSTLALTPEHPLSFVPQFTPDGKTVVFFRRDGDVYRVDADGRNLRRLTQGNRSGEFRLSKADAHGSSDPPHVSPDGRRIAYIAVKAGVPNVCTMNIDGSQQKQISFRKTPCGRVRWNPDGKALAFVSFEGNYPQLFVVGAEGGEPRRLTSVEGAVYFLSWRPK